MLERIAHKWAALSLVGALLSTLLATQTFSQEISKELAEKNRRAHADLTGRFWAIELEASPFLASSHGMREADAIFPQEGVTVRHRRTSHYFQLMKEVSSADVSGLGEQEKLDLELLGRELSERLDGYRLNDYLTPVHQRGGPQIWLPTFHERMRFERVLDYENYLARLEAIPAYLVGVRELLDAGIERGVVPPKITQVGVLEQFDAHLVDEVANSLFFQPFTKFPKLVPEAERERLTTRGQVVIMEKVIPALRGLRAFLADEYVYSCRDSIGALDLPQGDDFYAHQVRHFTTTYLDPGEIHLRGMREVERIRGEMQKVIEKTGFEGDFAAFVEYLRSDPRFYHKTPEALLSGYRDICKRIDALLPEYFGLLPRSPYGVKAIPDYEAPRSTTAYYQPVPADGSKPGWFYANTYELTARPRYEMVALTLHEAVPGHHLQIALANEIESLSPFRSSLHYTAFVEGWALYAESLGTEMGLYEDPYDDFGRLSYEMWRALRLVVDTGIHQFGWERQQAIDFMLENSSLTRTNVESEVDRYIAWPGQALAYKIGEMEIRRLRNAAEAALGSEFQIRSFHDHMLGAGSLPLGVLTARMEQWVLDQQEKESAKQPQPSGQ